MIKCNYCGSQLNMEVERCPFCNQDNPYFKKHREEMEAYQDEFEIIQDEVYSNARKVSRKTVSIGIISILIVLNLIVLVIWLFSSVIYDGYQDVKASMHAQQHREQLDAFELAGEYGSFNTYYYNQNLYSVDSLNDYDVVHRSISAYVALVDDLFYYQDVENDYGREYFPQSVAWNITQLYSCMEYNEYEEEGSYSPQHLATMERLIEDAKVLLLAYTSLTQEEVEQLDTYDEIDLASMLKEGN